jgi:hypothetical protein
MTRLSLAAIALVGCGLVSSNITQVQVGIPAHSFSVDTADWHVNASQTVPTVPCSAACDQISSMFCSPGVCAVDCNDSTSNCEGIVDITLVNDFNLAQESPEYAQFASASSIKVGVDDVWFQISENSLSVATPPLNIYVGPMSASKPTDAGVALVGTLPSLAVGQTGKAELQFAAGGKDALGNFMNDYKTPFRIIVDGEYLLEAGDRVPTGRLAGTVQATAHVGL